MLGNFEKPPVPKTPEEKEKDLHEWKKHFGIQAEMAEEREKSEEKKKQEPSKAGQEKEWKEHFGVQAEIAEEAEKKAKEEKEWKEHFGPLAELQEEAEKIPGVSKQEKPSEIAKAAEPEREKLMKTELDPEYVLGKERAKLAEELRERMRRKSAGEIEAAAEKESPQKREKAPFSLKRFLEELDMQETLKLVKTLEKFAKRERAGEKSKEKPAAKQEKTPFSLKRFLEDLDMQETLKLVKTLEKFVKKEKSPFSFKKFLEKRRWKQTIKATEKLKEEIENGELEKKSPAKEKPPISLKEVLKKLGMDQTLKIWKSAEEFTQKRKNGESWRKFFEKMQIWKGALEESKKRLEQRKLVEEKKWLDSLFPEDSKIDESSREAAIKKFSEQLGDLGYTFRKTKNVIDKPLMFLLSENSQYLRTDELGNVSGFTSIIEANKFLEAELNKTAKERMQQREDENIKRGDKIRNFGVLLQELGYTFSIVEGRFGKLIAVKNREGKGVYFIGGESLGFTSYTKANEFLEKKLKDIEEANNKAEKPKEETSGLNQ